MAVYTLQGYRIRGGRGEEGSEGKEGGRSGRGGRKEGGRLLEEFVPQNRSFKDIWPEVLFA